MSLNDLTQAIRTKVGDDCGLDVTLKFDLGSDGVIVVDAKSTPNTVTNTDAETDCTVAISMEHLQAMLAGSLDPVSGFMSGKLRVSGDMGVAMRLQRVV